MKKLIIGVMAALAAAATFAAGAAFTYQGVIREVGGAVPFQGFVDLLRAVAFPDGQFETEIG